MTDFNLVLFEDGAAAVVALQRGETFWLEGAASVFVAAGRVEVFGATLDAGATQTVHATTNALLVECVSTKKRGVKRRSRDGSAPTVAASLASDDAVHRRVAELTTGEARGQCAVLVLRSLSGSGGPGGFAVSAAAAAAVADGSDAAAAAAAPRRAISVPAAWRTVAAQLCADSRDAGSGSARRRRRPTRVLICGPKGVGKSTFGRYLLNRLLAAQMSGKGVAYLETDLGQSEFTPAGVVALHRVVRPVLGPPHTHVRPPRSAYFVGAATPEQMPATYLKCVRAAFGDFAADLDVEEERAVAPQRLLINTHGWVKGVGSELLHAIIAEVEPTHIVKIEGTTRTKMFELKLPLLPPSAANGNANAAGGSGPLAFQPEVLEMTSWTATFPRAAITAAKLRALQLSAYFLPDLAAERAARAAAMAAVATVRGGGGDGGGDGDGEAAQGGAGRPRLRLPQLAALRALSPAQALALQRPYAVRCDALAVRVMHERVQPDQVLYALNGAIVGLTRVEGARGGDDAVAGAGGIVVLRETPIVGCVGLGIVRAIDPERRLLYIVTPLDLADLEARGAGINTLLLGSLALPKLLTNDATLRPAPYATPWSVPVSEVFRNRRF